MSTAIRTSTFLLWELSMSFYIFYRDSVCLVDHVYLICSWYSWWEGFGSSSTLPLGFNCGFISTSACGSSTGFAPEASLKDLDLPLWRPGVEVVQLLGLQGFWQHQVLRGVGSWGSRKYSALEGRATSVGQYAPVLANTLQYSCLENPLLTGKPGRPQSTGSQRVAHNRREPMCTGASLFLPVAALTQWGLSVKVAWLLGLRRPWWHQVCRDTDCLSRRSYAPIRVFFQASSSWQSEGLFG